MSFRAQSQLNSKRDNKTLETSKIMEALKKNDYPKWFLKRTVRSLKTKTNLSLADKKEIKTRVVLPYVPRYFEALSKILRNVGILVSSKPHLTLKDMLPKAKDSVERSSRPGVVYQILVEIALVSTLGKLDGLTKQDWLNIKGI